MWILAAAAAEPPPAWYSRVDDLDGHAQPQYPRRQPNTFAVWTEGETVRRFDRYARQRVAETRLYDARGWVSVAVTWASDPDSDGLATQAVVHLADPLTLDLTGWARQPLAGGATALHPPEGRLHSWVGPAADVRAEGFVAEQLAACGCALVEAQPDWLDGAPGVRLRLRTYALGPADEALLWAVPRPEGTVFIAFTATAPADPDAALAPARAALATLTWPAAP